MGVISRSSVRKYEGFPPFSIERGRGANDTIEPFFTPDALLAKKSQKFSLEKGEKRVRANREMTRDHKLGDDFPLPVRKTECCRGLGCALS